MKKLLLSVFFLFYIIGSASANLYFPEGVGSTWTYAIDGDLFDTVTRTLISPWDFDDFEGEQSHFQKVADNIWGLGWSEPTVSLSYSPAILLLPSSATQAIYQNHEIVTVSITDSGVTSTETWDVTVELAANQQTVTVPAGTFYNCIHLNHTVNIIPDSGQSQLYFVDDFWYAPNVGLIKHTEYDTPYDGEPEYYALFELTDYQIVPIPGAFLLFGSGILGLLRLRRYNPK